MRIQVIITIALITSFAYGQLRQPRYAIDQRSEQVSEPLYPERYTAPVENKDIIAIYNLSPNYNPVVLEVRDNRDPDIRHVITGGWVGPYQVFMLPVQELSGDGPDDKPWEGTLWAFADHRISISVGDGDHIHDAVKVPEHFGLQVDAWWRDLLEEGPE